MSGKYNNVINKRYTIIKPAGVCVDSALDITIGNEMTSKSQKASLLNHVEYKLLHILTFRCQ